MTASCKLVVFLAEDQIAEAFVDRGDSRFHGGATSLGRFTGGRDAECDRRAAHGDAHLRLAAAADQVGQHRLQIALTDAEAFDPTIADHPRRREHRADRRRDRFVPHSLHFGRHAGEGEDAAHVGWGGVNSRFVLTGTVRSTLSRRDDVDARRGPFGIWNHAASFGEHRLHAVSLRHRPLPPSEQPLDVLKRRLVKNERLAGCGGDGVAGEVVGRRAETA